MALYSSFAFWLVRGRRKDNRDVEIFQVGKSGLQCQLISCVFFDRSLQVIRDKIFGYRSVKLDGVNRSGDKAWQLFIQKCFGIDFAADAERCSKEMDFTKFSRYNVYQSSGWSPTQSMYIFSPGMRSTAMDTFASVP